MSLPTLEHLFDPEQFRANGHALVELLAEQLALSLHGKNGLMKWQAPQAAEQAWQQTMPETPELDSAGLIEWIKQEVLPRNLNMYHPHSMAHQAAPPLPVTVLSELVAAFSNQAMATYETGPVATLMERQLIRWLNALVGWPEGSGVLTSGGSQANLTALLVARQQVENSIWAKGISAGSRLRILTSTLSHYSIRRAAGIMGLGADAVISVAVDEQGRMCMRALQEAYEQCKAHNEQVMAVVATAGCTATGSIDPLREIGEYCRAHDLWLHIDAAHGASILLSNQHREKLHGMALADSLSWDGHKLSFMPATVSAVLFREDQASYRAFSQDASYLFHEEDDMAELSFHTSYRTLECTKRMMALKWLAAFKLHGRQGMAALVEHVFSLAEQFSGLVADAAGFALLMAPQTNIVCFRYVGKPDVIWDAGSLNVLQSNIRQQLLHQEMFHLSQVDIDNTTWLRCVIMNPYTDCTHHEALLKAVAILGESLISQGRT